MGDTEYGQYWLVIRRPVPEVPDQRYFDRIEGRRGIVQADFEDLIPTLAASGAEGEVDIGKGLVDLRGEVCTDVERVRIPTAYGKE